MVAISALTTLAEDELLLRTSVFKFAQERIGPLVSAMDAEAKMQSALLGELFELGVMGIEVPREYGGSGMSFMHAILAVEAFARVDASVAVLVDVQNTLVNNALLRW